ncbi:ABC transporter ATP-binding protein [Roseinatronobacter alkalisoli]|uniref:ABC transporter ATP-binding protein n=1 Tax=Roseinatronobacter alkalisoli TaxID=3028235 RepID=A0ABT5T5I6_9RHOB|nr:ABC transporter ATP-binding protein [Roseinatronobacter sp. HJB301]MDD7969980.1 ABC transporter ATP-binding protein [Roseinatronobacter sp. HJB301]
MKIDPLNASSFALSATQIAKSFGDTEVLRNIHLDLAPGEVVALLGPSGCGKTTLLRIAAGLLTASAGQMQIAGKCVVDGRGVNTPPEGRGIGMVFQDYAIWPHLSVLENVAFPLRMRKLGRSARETRARRALDRVGLAHLAERFPGTLSGGQQQRVALARAIVAEPPLVLFDEPLSNLDRELREGLALEIGTLLRELGLSAIYVTHDQSEAFTIADRVAVMLGGEIAQIDTPERLFASPDSVDVAQFLNIGALIDGHVCSTQGFTCSRNSLKLPDLALSAQEGPARILIPRTAIRLASDGALTAQVLRCQFQGDRYLLHLGLDGDSTRLVCPTDRPAALNSRIPLAIDADRLRVFPH